MKTLFIDTHQDIHIALIQDFTLLKEKRIIGQKENSTILMNAILDVLDDDNYDQILVVNGPGSFTGVRLGVTIAKTLAYTQNIPIKVISYLTLMSICSEGKEKVVAFNDRNGYFVGYFDEMNNKTHEFKYLKNDDYNKIITNVTTTVEPNFKKIIEYINNIEAINPHNVKPIYVKKIEVEL